MVSWNKIVDTETGERYYIAKGISRLLAKLIYRTDTITNN